MERGRLSFQIPSDWDCRTPHLKRLTRPQPPWVSSPLSSVSPLTIVGVDAQRRSNRRCAAFRAASVLTAGLDVFLGMDQNKPEVPKTRRQEPAQEQVHEERSADQA